MAIVMKVPAAQTTEFVKALSSKFSEQPILGVRGDDTSVRYVVLTDKQNGESVRTLKDLVAKHSGSSPDLDRIGGGH